MKFGTRVALLAGSRGWLSLVVPSIKFEGTWQSEEEGDIIPIIGTLFLITISWIWWVTHSPKGRVKEITLPNGLKVALGNVDRDGSN